MDQDMFSRRRPSGREMVKERHLDFYAKMGWSHGPLCICKEWEQKNKTENHENIRKQA